jgi:hypothetical protein
MNKKDFKALVLVIGVILVLFVVGFVNYVESNNQRVWENFATCGTYWSRGGFSDGNHPWPRDCNEVLEDLLFN